MQKEDFEGGKLMYLASTNENVLFDPNFRGFRAESDKYITNLVATLVKGVRDVLDRADSAHTGFLSSVVQLENSDAGRRLLGAANTDTPNGGNGTDTSGGGFT